MARAAYIGVNNTARKLKSIYVGLSGDEGGSGGGSGGDVVTGTPASSISVGEIITLNLDCSNITTGSAHLRSFF